MNTMSMNTMLIEFISMNTVSSKYNNYYYVVMTTLTPTMVHSLHTQWQPQLPGTD